MYVGSSRLAFLSRSRYPLSTSIVPAVKDRHVPPRRARTKFIGDRVEPPIPPTILVSSHSLIAMTSSTSMGFRFLGTVLLFQHFVYGQVPDLEPQLSEVISYNAERFDECTSLISTCPGTVASECHIFPTEIRHHLFLSADQLHSPPMLSYRLRNRFMRSVHRSRRQAAQFMLRATERRTGICLSSYFHPKGGGAGASVIITSPPTAAATTNPSGEACISLSNLAVSCENATPGFDNLDDAD
jgi:hypothetical protein